MMKNYLVILKRFELWLLFAVVAGLLVFAFRSTPDAPDPASGRSEPSARPPTVAASAEEEAPRGAPREDEAPTRLTVNEVRVTPSGSGRIVELALLARAPGEEPVVLDEQSLSATDEDGAPVPRFFEPFAAEPEALPGDGDEVVVRLWLERPAKLLWLDYLGETAKAELPE